MLRDASGFPQALPSPWSSFHSSLGEVQAVAAGFPEPDRGGTGILGTHAPVAAGFPGNITQPSVRPVDFGVAGTLAFLLYLGRGRFLAYPSLAPTTAYYSRTFGRTWEAFTLPAGEKTSYSVTAHGRVLISTGVNSTSTAYLVSQDYGQSFTSVTGPSLFQYARTWINSSTFVSFGFNSSTIVRSVDGGFTLSSFTGPTSAQFNDAISDGTTVLCAARNSATGVVSYDGGQTFATITFPASGVFPTVYHVGGGTFLLSVSSAANTPALWVGRGRPLTWVPAVHAGLTVGIGRVLRMGNWLVHSDTLGRYWASRDGQFWSLMSWRLPGGLVTSPVCAGSNWMLVFGSSQYFILEFR